MSLSGCHAWVSALGILSWVSSHLPRTNDLELFGDKRLPARRVFSSSLVGEHCSPRSSLAAQRGPE